MHLKATVSLSTCIALLGLSVSALAEQAVSDTERNAAPLAPELPAFLRQAPALTKSTAPAQPPARAVAPTAPSSMNDAVVGADTEADDPVMAPPAATTAVVQATPLPRAAAPAAPAQQAPAMPAPSGLRVYFAPEATELSGPSLQAVGELVAQLGAGVLDIHVANPSGSNGRLIALRQAGLQDLLRDLGVNSSRLRFRMLPFGLMATDGGSAPLSPHYAELRLVESNS